MEYCVSLVSGLFSSYSARFGMPTPGSPSSQADTSVLVVDPERLDRLIPSLPKLKSSGLKRIVLIRSEGPIDKCRGHGVDVSTMEEMEAEMEKEFRGRECALPDVNPDPEDDATILFTSGTTGKNYYS